MREIEVSLPEAMRHYKLSTRGNRLSIIWKEQGDDDDNDDDGDNARSRKKKKKTKEKQILRFKMKAKY